MRIKIPVPTIIVVALILVAVLLPSSSLPDAPGLPGLDKLVHFMMFLTLAVAAQLDFKLEDRSGLVIALVAAIAFSALTELLQLFAEGRSADFIDMVADMVGYSAGLCVRKPVAAAVRKIGSRIAAIFNPKRIS